MRLNPIFLKDIQVIKEKSTEEIIRFLFKEIPRIFPLSDNSFYNDLYTDFKPIEVKVINGFVTNNEFPRGIAQDFCSINFDEIVPIHISFIKKKNYNCQVYFNFKNQDYLLIYNHPFATIIKSPKKFDIRKKVIFDLQVGYRSQCHCSAETDMITKFYYIKYCPIHKIIINFENGFDYIDLRLTRFSFLKNIIAIYFFDGRKLSVLKNLQNERYNIKKILIKKDGKEPFEFYFTNYYCLIQCKTILNYIKEEYLGDYINLIYELKSNPGINYKKNNIELIVSNIKKEEV